MSIERDLLERCAEAFSVNTKCPNLIIEIKELLAQPEQDTLTLQQGIEKYKRGYALGYRVAREDYKQKVINAFGVDDEY